MTIKEIEIQLALGSLTDDMKVKLVLNPNTPEEILTELSTDEDWYIRYWVAFNSSTPTEILTKLSTDENEYIKSCVADNPNAKELQCSK